MVRNKKIMFFTLFLLISCSSEKNIRAYKLEKINILKEPILDDFQLDESKKLEWIKPESWIPSSGSSMRLLSFSIPYSEGLADLSVIKLNSKGGGLESNVNRWRKQLDLSELNIIEIDKEIILIEGDQVDYKMLEIVNFNDDRAFVCSIFSLPKSTYFVKVALNIKGINEIKSDFIQFCSSLKFIE